MLRQTTLAHPRESGFTLLEILIAVVILTVGLLGLAGLQARSLQANQSALTRSQAVVLSYDIIDRLRANRASARDGVYNQPLASGHPTAGTMESDDIIAWLTEIERRLPAGDGEINVAADVVTVRVQWDDTHGGAPAQQFVVESRL